jgi:hypothetical protein
MDIPIARILSALILVGATAVSASAQQPSGGGGDFCALTGTDLLAALDGSWTVTNKAGTAVAREPTHGGIIAFPYPAGPPGTIIFKYDPERRVIDATDPDKEVEMVLVPTGGDLGDLKPVTDALVGARPADWAACDWSTVPTVMGGSGWYAYSVTRPGDFYGELAAELIYNCETYQHFGLPELSKNCDQDLLRENLEGPYLLPGGSSRFDVRREDFEMSMTLFLRFSSANSASGSLFFEGSQDGSTFKAYTPVTLSRR